MKHMTSSMDTFLQSIFPQAPIHLKDWPDWANTCIVNSISRVNWTQGRISLVLKKTNLRKWNSHEWHLRSFAKQSHYCFLTDVGCQYSSTLMYKFIAYLDDHPKCVAVTGRRIEQTPYQQANPLGASQGDTISESLLRAIQANMFDQETNTVMALGNVFGAIPVLHGPCTFYDYRSISQTKYIDLYFQLAYESPSNIGLIMSEVRLAEDSVQSIYLLTNLDNRSDAETNEVTDAVFYFDVELTWENLVKQRRRWENSNFACSIYALFGAVGQPDTIWNSQMPFAKKIGMSFCNFCNMMSVIINKFAVASYATLFYYFNFALVSLVFGEEMNYSGFICLAILSLYLALYAAFVWKHTKRQSPRDCSFDDKLWTAVILFNTLEMIVVIMLVPFTLFFDIPMERHDSNALQIIALLALIGNYFPILRTIYIDPKRVLNVFCNISIMIFAAIGSPMVNAFFKSYFLSRALDLSWGNRPGGDLLSPVSAVDSKRKTCNVQGCMQPLKEKESETCIDHSWLNRNIYAYWVINILVVVANIVVALCMVLSVDGMYYMQVYCFILSAYFSCITVLAMFIDFVQLLNYFTRKAIMYCQNLISSNGNTKYEPC